MLDNPPTIDSLGPQDDLRSYKRWEEMHSRIMQEPPRDYINHVINVLPFIEAISDYLRGAPHCERLVVCNNKLYSIVIDIPGIT